MKSVAIFIHPNRDHSVVKNGFNWGAFLLPVYWAYSEGMIRLGGKLIAFDGIPLCMILVADYITKSAITTDTTDVSNFIVLALSVFAVLVYSSKHLFCGLYGNRLKIKDLELRGFKKIQNGHLQP